MSSKILFSHFFFSFFRIFDIGFYFTGLFRSVIFLDEVANSPTHELREAFDRALKNLVTKLKTNEEFRLKGEEVKAYVQNNPELADYARGLWKALRDWLSNDLESTSPQLQQQVERMGLWLGQKLAQDPELRTSINDHMQALASNAAP